MYSLARLTPFILLLCSCAAQNATTSATGTVAQTGNGEGGASTRWNNPAAIRHIFPQGEGLSLARPLCPFLYQRGHGATPSLVATYDKDESYKEPMSLHLSFGSHKGATAGWGIGCLRQYDARLYSYLVFWIKGRLGDKYRFVLKDSASMEGIIDRRITGEGWHRVLVPLADLKAKGVDTSSLESFSLRFTAVMGDSELYVDEFEFITR